MLVQSAVAIPWSVRSAAQACRLLVAPMAVGAGVAVMHLRDGRVAVVALAAALVLMAVCFVGPLWLLRSGQPGGVVAVATLHLVGCLAALPGIVPPSVLSPRSFWLWLLFAPVSLYPLISLWLPTGRTWLAERRARVRGG